jgi:2-phosphosulfolactate phosphatase
MRIEVFFGASGLAPSDVSGRVIIVIDVLRASTSISVALANGARAVIPLDSPDDVVTRSKHFDRAEVRLAGERKMVAIPGFDLGNSPHEFTSEAVEGKTVLMTTTNGTNAIVAAQGARDVVVASYVNFSVVSSMVRAALRGGTDVGIICAGRDKAFALEDAACAGRYARHVAKRLNGVEMDDAARACALIDRQYGDNLLKLFGASEHGRALAAAGFNADLELCAMVDAFAVVPVYQDRQITKLGPDRER